MRSSFSRAKNKWDKMYDDEKNFVTKCKIYPEEVYTKDFHRHIFEDITAKKGLSPTPFIKIYRDIYDKHFDTRTTFKKAIFNANAKELNTQSAPVFNKAFKDEAALRGMTKAPQIKIAEMESIFEEEGRIVREHRPGLMVNDPALV